MSLFAAGRAFTASDRASSAMRLLVFFYTTLLLTGAVVSQQSAESKGSPVLLHGTPVFQIQWGYGNFPPEYRASVITSKLKAVADDPTIKPEVKLVPNELGIDIVAGNVLLGSVFPGDARASGLSKEELAQQWKSAIERSIVDYRARYGWQRRVARGVAVLLLIGLCALLLMVVRRVTHALS